MRDDRRFSQCSLPCPRSALCGKTQMYNASAQMCVGYWVQRFHVCALRRQRCYVVAGLVLTCDMHFRLQIRRRCRNHLHSCGDTCVFRVVSNCLAMSGCQEVATLHGHISLQCSYKTSDDERQRARVRAVRALPRDSLTTKAADFVTRCALHGQTQRCVHPVLLRTQYDKDEMMWRVLRAPLEALVLWAMDAYFTVCTCFHGVDPICLSDSLIFNADVII